MMPKPVILTAITCLTAACVAADDPECPVVSAGGVSTKDGSVFVLGQAAIGLANNRADLVELGAVPCWLVVDCPGDLDGSGAIDLDDLLILLGDFGNPGPGAPGDADGDGDTDLDDLLTVLGGFGVVCK